MSTNTTEKIQSILLFGLIFILALLAIFKPSKALSSTERRPLQQFPSLDSDQLMNGRWMKDFENYTMDQFPLRERFRSLKAVVETDLLLAQSNNEVSEVNGHLSELDYPLNLDSLDHAASVIRQINERYLASNNVYFSIIPDKNYYLSQEADILTYDYETLFSYMEASLDFAQPIDITGCLELDDYYRTDIHWRQEALGETAAILLEAMGETALPSVTLELHRDDFQGVYSGRYAKPVSADSIYYFDSLSFVQLEVYDYESDQSISLYQPELMEMEDPYAFFLHGSLSLITIDNPAAASSRELLVFRDSFGSAIAPLFTEAYSRVTLIDIRYLASNLLPHFINFENQDVLFLYSSSILNNSSQLK